MKINFISKINKSENKKIIWSFLIAGFILSITSLIYSIYIGYLIGLTFSLISPYQIISILWFFLPYIIFSIIALRTKEKITLITTGLIILLVNIYFNYISFISTSVGGSLTLFFTPIILIVLIFVLIGIGKLLKRT